VPCRVRHKPRLHGPLPGEFESRGFFIVLWMVVLQALLCGVHLSVLVLMVVRMQVCSGDGHCHGPSNICNAECGVDADCMTPCAVCSGDGKCVGSSNVCLTSCGTDADCTDPCSLCGGDGKCRGPDNICGAECGVDSDCGWSCPTCSGDSKCH